MKSFKTITILNAIILIFSVVFIISFSLLLIITLLIPWPINLFNIYFVFIIPLFLASVFTLYFLIYKEISVDENGNILLIKRLTNKIITVEKNNIKYIKETKNLLMSALEVTQAPNMWNNSLITIKTSAFEYSLFLSADKCRELKEIIPDIITEDYESKTKRFYFIYFLILAAAIFGLLYIGLR